LVLYNYLGCVVLENKGKIANYNIHTANIVRVMRCLRLWFQLFLTTKFMIVLLVFAFAALELLAV